jgi:hypothetical protein
VSLLNAKYSLLGIADVEAFTARIVERSGLRLSPEDREELHVYLIEEAWLLSERYRPGGVSFSTVAGTTLRLRVVDWKRARWGRTRWAFSGHTYERERPQLVSLDADDPEHDRVGTTLSGGSLDDGASRLADELRALDKRGRRPSRRRDWLGDEAA